MVITVCLFAEVYQCIQAYSGPSIFEAKFHWEIFTLKVRYDRPSQGPCLVAFFAGLSALEREQFELRGHGAWSRCSSSGYLEIGFCPSAGALLKSLKFRHVPKREVCWVSGRLPANQKSSLQSQVMEVSGNVLVKCHVFHCGLKDGCVYQVLGLTLFPSVNSIDLCCWICISYHLSSFKMVIADISPRTNGWLGNCSWGRYRSATES